MPDASRVVSEGPGAAKGQSKPVVRMTDRDITPEDLASFAPDGKRCQDCGGIVGRLASRGGCAILSQTGYYTPSVNPYPEPPVHVS